MAIVATTGALSASDSTASTSRTISFTITAGATVLVVCVGGGGGGGHATGVSDTLGNIYGEIAPWASNTLNNDVSVWGLLSAVTGGSTTITITWSTTATLHAAVQQYTGVTCFGANNAVLTTGTSLSVAQTTVDNNNFVVSLGGAVGTSDYTNVTGNIRQHAPGASGTVCGVIIQDNTAATPSSVTCASSISASAVNTVLSVELRTGGAAWSLAHAPTKVFNITSSGSPATLGWTPTAGNMLVLAMAVPSSAAAVSTVTDDGGSTWGNASPSFGADTTGNRGTHIWWANANAGITAITVTTTNGAQVFEGWVYEVAGLKNQNAEAHNNLVNGVASGTSAACGAVTEATSFDFTVNVIYTGNFTTSSLVDAFLPSWWTSDHTGGNAGFSHKSINFALHRNYNAQWTLAGSNDDYCASTASFVTSTGAQSGGNPASGSFYMTFELAKTMSHLRQLQHL